jgi:hypothetical protein
MNLDLLNKMHQYGFRKFGDFRTSEDQKVNYFPLTGCEDKVDKPKVYIWITLIKNETDVLYIGKTQFDIKKRMTQHRQGFKGNLNNGSISGSRKYKAMIDIFNANGKIEVWAKVAGVNEFQINGIKTVPRSFYSVEEEYFIHHFRNILNFQLPHNAK